MNKINNRHTVVSCIST